MASRTASVRLDHVTDQLFGDEADSALTVGAAASRLGITVRTLHHWDAIGLVRPSGRSDGGYRLYTDADLGRIGRVLVYRDVGLSLDEIGILLDAPAAHVDETLRGQRAELRQRIADLEELGESLDRIIDARKSGVLLPAHEQVSIFGRHWQPSWGPEAHERWGDSAQWAQHAERSAGRTAEDWQKIADCVETLNEDLALACRSGVEPGSGEANLLAERHRASIGVYFDCTHSMQVCLGRMYVGSGIHRVLRAGRDRSDSVAPRCHRCECSGQRGCPRIGDVGVSELVVARQSKDAHAVHHGRPSTPGARWDTAMRAAKMQLSLS